MTVSRALRGERYVDAEKRKRIRALARQLGYRPNPAATRLRARRGKKAMEIREFVALLVEKKDPNWALSWKHRNFVQGVRSRAEQFGYKLLLIWLYEPGWTIGRVERLLVSSNVRGIVFFPEDYEDISADLLKLLSRRFCAVIGGQPVRHPFHFAANDDFSSAKNVARRALAHSYQRPGFALLRKIDELIERRYSAGFRSVQQVLPRANQVPVLLLESFSDREFLKWYQKYQPDVIITHNRRVAVEEWLRPLKLGVPRDVGWITLDIAPGDDRISGLDARSELVGAAALDLVLDQMQRDEPGLPPFQKAVVIEGVWREGRTLRKLDGHARRRTNPNGQTDPRPTMSSAKP
jgi:LacI family transcriptional regulator